MVGYSVLMYVYPCIQIPSLWGLALFLLIRDAADRKILARLLFIYLLIFSVWPLNWTSNLGQSKKYLAQNVMSLPENCNNQGLLFMDVN